MADVTEFPAWSDLKPALLSSKGTGDQYTTVTYNVLKSKSELIPGTKLQIWKDFVYSILDKYSSPGGSVMETGCAAGLNTAVFAEKGYNMVASDIDGEMIERAKQNRNIMVDSGSPSFGLLQSDMKDLKENLKKHPDLPQAYDVVMCCGTLYYIIDRDDLLSIFQNFADILRPGGALFIENRSFHSILERGYAVEGGKYPYDLQTAGVNEKADPSTQLVKVDPYVIYGPRKIPLTVYMDYRWKDGSSSRMLFNPLMPQNIKDAARLTFGTDCKVTVYNDLIENHPDPINARCQYYVVEKPTQ